MGFIDKIKSVCKREPEFVKYELQEYGSYGGRGWVTIAGMDKPLKPHECEEYFKPGRIYRLLPRDLESGTYKKAKWKHYEPKPGIESHEVSPEALEKLERRRQRRQPASASEVMTAWAGELQQALQPLMAISDVIATMRDALSKIGGVSAGEKGGIPPPEFEGKLPSIMHPYVISNIGETVKDITDNFFTRLEETRQKFMAPPETSETEVASLPSIEQYIEEEPEPVAQPTEAEEAEVEPEVEESGGGEKRDE